MRKTFIAAIAAAALLLVGCRGESSTEPHDRVSLAGSWVGTHGPVTIHIDVHADSVCSRSYGYCVASGSGSFDIANGISGTFAFSVDYYFVGDEVIVMNIGGFGTDANLLFGGKFDSETQISGRLSETSSVFSPLNVGVVGIPITLVRQ
jgi:hypothetical protein